MKKTPALLIILITLFPALLNAQPAADKDSSGYLPGEVRLANNTTITGAIKDNIRKKGEIIVFADKKKTKYNAADITSVQIDKRMYVTNNYTFYELLWKGNTISLLRKANEPSGVYYNGAQPIIVSAGEGDTDDYFIAAKNESSFQLLTRKNIKEIAGTICNACAVDIDGSKFDIEMIKKVMETCDKCK